MICLNREEPNTTEISDLEPDRGTLKEGDVSTMESRAATLTNGSVDQSIASSGIHIRV